LTKIGERHQATLAEAEQGCLQLLDLAGLDTNPMVNAWQGVDAQLHQLRSKIQATWEDKVEAAFEQAYEEAELDADADEEFAAGERLMRQLEVAAIRAEAGIFGQAADRLMEAAFAELAKSFSCTQCGASLPVKSDSFRSYYLACEHCDMTNTFEPGTKVRNVEHFCSHHIARRDTLELDLAQMAKWDEVRAARTASLEQLKDLERAVSAYWNAFFARRAELVPAYLKDVAKDVDARMRAFYTDMGRQDNWQADGTDPRFNQEKIYRHIEQIGASVAAAGEFPESIYTHFKMVFDEDAIKAWLGELWDKSLSKQVDEYYQQDLSLFRQLMPTPKNPLYAGFIAEMEKTADVIKRTKRKT
jgi:hypothetical protein